MFPEKKTESEKPESAASAEALGGSILLTLPEDRSGASFRFRLPSWDSLLASAGRLLRFADLTGPAGFDRERSDLDARGLFLDMPAWGYHVFEVTTLDEARVDGRPTTDLSSHRASAVQTR